MSRRGRAHVPFPSRPHQASQATSLTRIDSLRLRILCAKITRSTSVANCSISWLRNFTWARRPSRASAASGRVRRAQATRVAAPRRLAARCQSAASERRTATLRKSRLPTCANSERRACRRALCGHLRRCPLHLQQRRRRERCDIRDSRPCPRPSTWFSRGQCAMRARPPLGLALEATWSTLARAACRSRSTQARRSTRPECAIAPSNSDSTRRATDAPSYRRLPPCPI